MRGTLQTMRTRQRMRTGNTAGRNTAMLLGGIAAGIVASRLLPPVLATIIGSGKARAGADPFARLINDHRQLLSLLDEMVTVPADATLRRSRLFLMLKRKLAKHALAEEDVVYPTVQSFGTEGDERKRLYGEHAEMKILLYALETHVKAGEDWSGAVLALRDLVRRHADEEETTIFPALRQQLTKATMPKMSGQISREEALVL